MYVWVAVDMDTAAKNTIAAKNWLAGDDDSDDSDSDAADQDGCEICRDRP